MLPDYTPGPAPVMPQLVFDSLLALWKRWSVEIIWPFVCACVFVCVFCCVCSAQLSSTCTWKQTLLLWFAVVVVVVAATVASLPIKSTPKCVFGEWKCVFIEFPLLDPKTIKSDLSMSSVDWFLASERTSLMGIGIVIVAICLIAISPHRIVIVIIRSPSDLLPTFWPHTHRTVQPSQLIRPFEQCLKSIWESELCGNLNTKKTYSSSWKCYMPQVRN